MNNMDKTPSTLSNQFLTQIMVKRKHVYVYR
jgi:hypothetical protein